MMKRNKWLMVPMILLSVCILAVIGYYGYTVYSEMKDAADLVEMKKHLTSEEKAARQNNYFAQLKSEMEREIEEAKGEGKVGLAFYDVDTKTAIMINENELFDGASTIKLPITMLIADQLKTGEQSLDNEVWYLSTDYEGGTGKIQENVQPSYKIEELIDYSLKNSDNIANNMLKRQLGGTAETIKQIGEKYLNDPNIDTEHNQISAARGMAYLRRLYENPDQVDYYSHLIDDLKDTDFKERLYTEKTKDIVAHKVGSSESNIHDMGIFYASHPYLLVVCTNEVKNADELISKISNTVYDFQTKEYPDENEKTTVAPKK